MNNTESMKILAILKAAYPNSYKGMTADDAAATAAVWQMQFANVPVEIVMLAINKAISVCKYPPTIAEVKKKIQSVYWDAYSALDVPIVNGNPLPAAERARLERIQAATRAYKSACDLEPDVKDMLPSVERMLLGE